MKYVRGCLFSVGLFIFCGCGAGSASDSEQDVSGNADTPVQLAIELVLVEDRDSVTEEQAAYIFQKVEEDIERVFPVDLLLTRFEVMQNPIPDVQEQEAIFDAWFNFFKQAQRLDNTIVATLIPPYKRNGAFLFGGMASGACTIGRSSAFLTATVGATSDDGHDRILRSIKVLTHEIGHVLGAKHHRGGVMAVSFKDVPVTPDLSFDALSKQEIHRCLAGLKQI